MGVAAYAVSMRGLRETRLAIFLMFWAVAAIRHWKATLARLRKRA